MGHWCGLWQRDQGVRTLVSTPVKEHQLGCSRFPIPEEIIAPLSYVVPFVFTSKDPKESRKHKHLGGI